MTCVLAGRNWGELKSPEQKEHEEDALERNVRAEQDQRNPKMPGVHEYGRHGGEDGRINGAKMWKILTIKKRSRVNSVDCREALKGLGQK